LRPVKSRIDSTGWKVEIQGEWLKRRLKLQITKSTCWLIAGGRFYIGVRKLNGFLSGSDGFELVVSLAVF
jgi:hypothetical protein